MRISTGDVIKWRGVSGTHTVSAYGANWSFNKDLSTGDVEDRTFRRAGKFKFRCMFHSTLTNGRLLGDVRQGRRHELSASSRRWTSSTSTAIPLRRNRSCASRKDASACSVIPARQ